MTRKALAVLDVQAISSICRQVDAAFFSNLESVFGDTTQACNWLASQACGISGEAGERELVAGSRDYVEHLIKAINRDD